MVLPAEESENVNVEPVKRGFELLRQEMLNAGYKSSPSASPEPNSIHAKPELSSHAESSKAISLPKSRKSVSFLLPGEPDTQHNPGAHVHPNTSAATTPISIHASSQSQETGRISAGDLTRWEKFDSSGKDKGYHMAFGAKKRVKIYPMSSSVTRSGKEEWFCPVDKR